MSMNVVEASGLGKRYGSTWALCECTLAVPPVTWSRWSAERRGQEHTAEPGGRPGGAVRGHCDRARRPAGSPAALDRIAFVAQDMPLDKNLSAADLLHLTRNLTRRFDERYAQARLAELACR